MKSRRIGRRKGSRNKGYFYRSGRGWVAKVGTKSYPLLAEDGERLKDRNAPVDQIKAAYDRWRTAQKPSGTKSESATVEEVCNAYLRKCQLEDAPKTAQDRAETLFDFCYGLPPAFRQSKRKPTKADRIHPGFGGLRVDELKPFHLEQWKQAHPNWNGGIRTRIQAVKRALNYAVEMGLISSNPIRGCRVPKVNGRVTYITPEQEAALCQAAKPAVAKAIKVCIRTGARPGCEFAALTAAHVKDHGERMEWVFQPHESKNGKLRTIYISDPEIIAIVQKQIAQHPEGPIFRTSTGVPWTEHNISLRFRQLKRKLIKQGIKFDADTCAYSMRHTYAKRTLEGYWTGKATSIETLARLMGNTPQVCREHYTKFDPAATDFLWQAC